MGREFVVKGVNPLGRIVELVMVADTAADARAIAEDTGLLYVVVKENPAPSPPATSPQASPGTQEPPN